VIAALEIGGTHFRYAAGTDTGELRTEIHTEPTEPGALAAQVISAVGELQQRSRDGITAVSIACRGVVDRTRGVLDYMDIQDGDTVRGLDLRGPVRGRFDIPLYLENDCTAAVLAEYYFGAGESYSTTVHVTIGTGIGAGVVENDRVLRGETGSAGEVGGIRVGPPDGLTSFGIPGAWEAYCSGPGIRAFVGQQLQAEDRDTRLDRVDDLSTPAIFETAGAGDPVAAEYLDTITEYNAVGLGTVCNLYNPGLVTLGGGVALNNPDYLVDDLAGALGAYLIVDEPELRLAALGDDVGIYGALARHTHAEHVPEEPPLTQH
jgi:glucokinase